MSRWLKFSLVFSSFCLIFLVHGRAQYVINTADLKIVISETGHLSALTDLVYNKEYLVDSVDAPLLTITCGQESEKPASMLVDKQTKGLLTLKYPKNNVSISVMVTDKGTHAVFEIKEVKPAGKVDAVTWGPFPVKISKTIGEIIGVLRNDEFAIGLQVLNVKTLGGRQQNNEGSDMSRGHTAEPKVYGAVLQAYCMDRSRPRKVDAYGGKFPDMPVPPIPGETVTGSKIALFGCRVDLCLDRLGVIEVDEGLPHPLIDGVWAKYSTQPGRSYLIADYDESNIDELLEYTQRGGFMTLYSMSPFKSWGHYEISTTSFPHGSPGLKQCVEKAKGLGIRLGAHTLTNFINTNDPYITPLPDPGLAKTGTSVLMEKLSENEAEIKVPSPEYFNNEKANSLHTIQIGNELIRYRAVSTQVPYIISDCERGAWGTQKTSHSKGTIVAKLADYPYKTFFPNFDLQNEIAINLANTFNATGLSQMDFDGHEGCQASGQGDYATEMFAKVFYDHIDHTVLNGTSNSGPFYWHINTYCNWGEPWYEGFRESMQEYRISNQGLFDRNFMPNMLGWYLLTETTTVSDMEWMLARAAGYRAGFALATSIDALRKNPQTGEILDAINNWEALRRTDPETGLPGNFEILRNKSVFTHEQIAEFRNPKTEFHLQRIDERSYDLYPFHLSDEYTYVQAVRQPGEPTSAEWEVVNPDREQLFQFRLKVVGDSGSITNPTLDIDHFRTLVFPVILKTGESLLCEGTQEARIYDSKGRQSRTVRTSIEMPVLATGRHSIDFDCIFSGKPAPKVVVSFRTLGAPQRVRR